MNPFKTFTSLKYSVNIIPATFSSSSSKAYASQSALWVVAVASVGHIWQYQYDNHQDTKDDNLSSKQQQHRHRHPSTSSMIPMYTALAEPSSRFSKWKRKWTESTPNNNKNNNDKNNKNRNDDSSNSKNKSNNDELFEGQCLKRQMYQPKVPYPAWDYNWDNKMTPETSLEAYRDGIVEVVPKKEDFIAEEQQEEHEKKSEKVLVRKATKDVKSKEAKVIVRKATKDVKSKEAKKRRKKTRHLILIRHGQYDERSLNEDERVLTPLGRFQARQTGRRLAHIARGATSFYPKRFNGPCHIKAIHVSDIIRAKETAELIQEEIEYRHPQYKNLLQPPDPLLNETLPAAMVPIRPDIIGAEEEIDENKDRVEEAFQKYFYRDDDDETADDESSTTTVPDTERDEFDIIVCHVNMIRYFFCRALQLPPEAWLRFSTFNCSITYLIIRPNGMVTARMMGDIGHLNYEQTTFSGYHGFKW